MDKELVNCRSVFDYLKLEELGQGAYSTVYKAIDIKSKEIFALKKLKFLLRNEGFPITAIRETKLLKECNHKNIIKLYEIVVGRKPNSIYLVLEYCDFDLLNFFKRLASLNKQWELGNIKYIMHQILQGVKYLHSNCILHRDLKLSNILLTKTGVVKITDFGLARHFSLPKSEWTPKWVTLWYRAPEILCNSQVPYSWECDMWAIGCIFAEMWNNGVTWFPGTNEVKQFQWICKWIGKPSLSTWKEFFVLEASEKLSAMVSDVYTDNTIKYVFDKLGNNLISWLEGMLAWDPSKRISAKEAWLNDFFNEYPSINTTIPCDYFT